MVNSAPTRKLAAILHTDVVGYSRLMGEDETGTHRTLREYLDTITTIIKKHQGRVVNYAGDAVLADFGTVTDALSAAVAIQSDINKRNQHSSVSEEHKVQIRIGVHLGEVIVDGTEIYGDGVNVAARLEGMAEPGSVCISEAVRSAVGTRLSFRYEFMGERDAKNISESIRAYRVVAANETSDSPPSCPYPGMRPFGTSDAQSFYGRTEEVVRMVQLLRRQRFFIVIGPSGSGKSSLVYAGLVPELEKSRYFAENYWLVRTMRPGARPSETLAKLIDSEHEDTPIDSDTVQTLLNAHPPAQQLLLLVDQFEEVFTLAEQEERVRFIAALQPQRIPDNCAFVLTLRADFYADLMTSKLWPVDSSQRVEVASLRGDDLRAAIENPAVDSGVHIEQGLVNQLLVDAADEPGVLPLLQETMGLLWDEMDQRSLSQESYQRLSDGTANHGNRALTGLAVAIATKADTTLAELSPSEKAIARRIFLRLIQFGEGRADTRRQQPVSALRAANDDATEFERTLEHLTGNRLLTRSAGHSNTDALVDISHESLIAGWSRLQGWIEDRRESEQVRRRLESKVTEWVRLGQGTGGLLDETELPEAERWLSSPDASDLGFDATLTSFVQASQSTIAQAGLAREAARQLEREQAEALAEEQRQRLTEQSRSAVRMRRSLAGLVALFFIALAAAALAWTQSQKAQENAKQAETRRIDAERARLSSIAQLMLIQAPLQQTFKLDERSALLARQGYLFSEHGHRALKEQVDSVLRTVSSKSLFSIQLRGLGSVYSVAFNPDGSQLASTHIVTGEVLVWDLTKPGSSPKSLPGWPADVLTEDGIPLGAIYSLAFSPDGRFLVAANEDGAIARWNLMLPSESPDDLGSQEAGVGSIAFSPDGKFFALGNRLDNTAQLWNQAEPSTEVSVIRAGPTLAPDAVPLLNQPGGVPVTFTPDSQSLITGSFDGVITLWDPANPSVARRSWQGHDDAIWALAVSPDGSTVASGGEDGSVRLWDLNNPTASFISWGTVDAPVHSVHFSPDGQALAGSGNWGIGLWDLKQPNKEIEVINGWINQVRFSPDGKSLASAGLDGGDSLRLWDLTPSGKPTIISGKQDFSSSLGFSPDGKWLASGGNSSDKNILLWNVEDTSVPPTELQGHDGWISSVAFSPDGNELASASDDSTVRVWTLGEPTGEKARLNLPNPWLARFSPDGNTLASGSLDGTYLWDVDDLSAEPIILQLAEGWMSEVAFSPDGANLAVSGDGDSIIRIQNINDLGAPSVELIGHELFAWSFNFSPNGKFLASGGKDATVRLWDLSKDNPPFSIIGRHDDEVIKVRFSPNGNLLATSSIDRTVRLWNVNDPDSIPAILHGHEDGIWSMAFSPDGKTLATGSTDIRLWDMTHPLIWSSATQLAERVCEKVWRNLTMDEWHRFVGADIPYERTCPSLPIHPSLLALAAKHAKDGGMSASIELLERAVALDPALTFEPQAEAERLATTVE